jgi:hypothetical protein
MELSMLFVSQRKLRAPGQLAALMACVRSGELLPPILLSEDDDGTVQIEDGHHRATAFWLCGRVRLEAHEYLLFPRTRRRPRFGRLADLVARVRAGGGLVGLRGTMARGRDPPARSRGGRVRRMLQRTGPMGQPGGIRPHLTEHGGRSIVGR